MTSTTPAYPPRLEQGRIRASAAVLTTLAEVLQLDEDQRTYLFSLAGKTSTRA
ncbi:transcriptional regulator, partial [Rothia sp. AR01]|nr:transcriptional regulator [Rothia santali]